MNLDKILISADTPLSKVIELLNENAVGIVIVIDKDYHITGTVTDGDVRRALMQSIDMTISAGTILQSKDELTPKQPISAPVGTDDATILSLMTEHRLHQIPLVDANNRIVDLVLLDDLVLENENSLAAVLMAGGFGKRLMPMTKETPKPMLEIGGKPIMERIIGQLRENGIGRVSVTTHYRHDQIVNHFGDGQDFGLEIDYVREDNPLGTAGALSMIEKPKQPVLVMNGDIITELNFRMFGKFHNDNNAVMTVAVRPYEYTVPFGVMETDGVFVKGVHEKPINRWMVNAGIYILTPEAFDFIPQGQYFDMPTLMDELIKNNKNVVCFPLYEYWKDIGRPQDFEAAEEDVKNKLGK
ncbi:nucleotidyltransferase family protein [Terasakiella sp. A23]|uniref:nucleotidyltransferase family protein n=1 Tax=Terasakiella sp. FCG-A23 TaxID=3080561 RepID=UPI002955B34A|nr:nucleotidyltransferase family protein [Terasakiella sp. A23]MDV7340809.1 nucleotidyltransferase family protein [Terasakiella sp. A23]